MFKKYVGRNDRKHNHNKYGVRVATDNNCVVLGSGAIQTRYLVKTTKKDKKKARK